MNNKTENNERLDPNNWKGSVKPVQATYHTPAAAIYQGNPLIHAIPKLPDTKGLIAKLECLPTCKATDAEASAADRREMLENLKFLFQPLPRHCNLAQDIYSMIRVGYGGRCPSWGKPCVHPVDRAMESAAFVGSSGTGKTTSVCKVLSLIPQVIIHSHFEGTDVSETQVSWLRMECPHDASPRGLCSSFFEKMDEILGTNYNLEFGGTRSTTNIMIPKVTQLVRQHYLGLLVIDEIQNLFAKHTNASKELRDFIVRIINDFRVPVLMVGTGETAEFLSESFRVSRRATGMLQPNWGRLVEHEREWTYFTDAVWKYRYVQKESELTPEMRHLLFDLTQGIPDLVIKLYFLSQRYAINEKVEQVTPEILRHVSDVALGQNRQYLADLRAGRIPKDSTYVDIDVYSQPDLALEGKLPEPKKQASKKRTQAPANAPGLTLPNLHVQEGESAYDAAKRQGLVHSE